MNAKTKIAIFDFCGTFVTFQTGDAFVRFVSNDLQNPKVLARNRMVLSICNKLKICSIFDRLFHWSLSKRIIAKQIKGIDCSLVENKAMLFYHSCIKPNLIKQAEELLAQSKAKGYFTILVSAAYNPYLTFFSDEYGFDAVISSVLSTRDSCMTGRIERDIYWKKKVKYVKRFLDEKFGKNGYEIMLSVYFCISPSFFLNAVCRRQQKRRSYFRHRFKKRCYSQQKG